MHKGMMNKVRDYLGRLQDALNFAGCENVPQYKDKHSQGRTGFLGYALGLVGGFHAALALCLFSFAPYGVFRSSLVRPRNESAGETLLKLLSNLLLVDYVGIARHISDHFSFPRVFRDIITAAVDAFK